VSDTPRQVLHFPPQLRAIPKSDRQGERQPASPHVRLMEQFKRTKAGLDSGMTAAEIRRYECARIRGIIKKQAEVMALFETPVAAANALRDVADEIEKGDAA
jgi:hypothetical protein